MDSIQKLGKYETIGLVLSIISNNIQNKRLFFGVKGVENKEQIL